MHAHAVRAQLPGGIAAVISVGRLHKLKSNFGAETDRMGVKDSVFDMQLQQCCCQGMIVGSVASHLTTEWSIR
jgi:hypothetical protein